ncbi:NucA/NucB deoxyribonuclease domain-containing protein [Streptomyces sp. NPDC001380]|uniref:NucA/NucB deoxyribonuclease domain-containing protein n=1 Tax=Streptomyces sp. NPDC001380 TaxID=3364566 RepID=UPI0036C3D6DA
MGIHRRIVTTIAATGSALALLLSPALPAQAAGAGAGGGALTVTGAGVPALTPTSGTAAAAVAQASALPCRPGVNKFNRTQVCMVFDRTVNVVRNGRTEGTLRFRVVQAMQLNVKSRTFTETVTLKGLAAVGNTGGITATLAVSCGGTCRAANHFPQGRILGARSTIQGNVTYTDSTTTQHTAANLYQLTLTKPGYTRGGGSWNSLAHRCDASRAFGRQGAGCVLPSYTPFLLTMKPLPGIAANIRRIQNAGPHHYGRYAASGGHPLHRTTSSALERANRTTACPGNRPRPTGKSCDEYPFAKTREGASRTTRPDWGWAWVPNTEQNQQGGRINAFFMANRVLDGDAFWVVV